MEKLPVNQLKKGWCISHPKYGCLQYRGLVTKHPYTDEPKMPLQYLFWQCVDQDGQTQPDVIIKNGKLFFEVTDRIEDYE